MAGHSQSFCRYLWPKLASAVPDSLPGSAEDLDRAVNDIRPSPIRINADEVTYNLHILLRVELEVDLLAVEDLAQAFADKMEAHLGLRPKDDAAGDFSSLRRWLDHAVYPHGHTMGIDALMTRVTGEPLNPEHWFRYLEQKYLPLCTERSD